VIDRPETRYVAVGDADVAYQVIGEGRADLLLCYGLGSHVDANWELPTFREFIERLAASFRVIIFDRRGTGASDGVPRHAVPTIEDWTDDIAAVLDASESQQATLYALVETGPIAIVYAAMHPERVKALILVNTSARVRQADDYPMGTPAADIDEFVDLIARRWGTTRFARLLHPNSSLEYIEAATRVMRASATPRIAAAQLRSIYDHHDVRSVLPLVRVPTLVLQVTDDTFHPIEPGRYLAEHIEGAKFVELAGRDSAVVLERFVVDEIAEFLTGERPPIKVDRVLTTVLFTDIVESTQRLAEVGDRSWREQLDRHDLLVRDELRRFHGRAVGTAGDSFFVSFDGPARAIQCAQAIVVKAAALGIGVRAGVHTGECELRGDDLGGIAVHIGARVAALATTGQVLTTSTVKELIVGSDIVLADRGVHDLKGVPNPCHLYEVIQ
jgi:pimeloyl-ACP methyl ester carboxylesterase